MVQVTTRLEEQRAFSLWLDLFRWMAAVAVLLGHIHHRVFIHFGDVPAGERSIAFTLISLASSIGPAGVIIFFVLSGFLVGGTSLEKYEQNKFDLLDYSVARMARLWTVLLPALCFTAVLLVTVHLYRGQSLSTFDLNPAGMACNALFLQTAFCGQYGDNGALWSLFNEAWYYVAWPFVMVALYGVGHSLRTRVLVALPAFFLMAGLSAAQFIGSSIGMYFGLWLLGVAVARINRPWIKLSALPSAGIFLACLLAWRILHKSEVQGSDLMHEFPVDLLLALGFANLLSALKVRTTVAPPLGALHTRLADFSFSLYCIHTPVLNFLLAMMALSVPSLATPMSPQPVAGYLIYGGLLVGSMAIAYLFYLATERHTYTVRRLVIGYLRGKQGADGRRATAETLAG